MAQLHDIYDDDDDEHFYNIYNILYIVIKRYICTYISTIIYKIYMSTVIYIWGTNSVNCMYI